MFHNCLAASSGANIFLEGNFVRLLLLLRVILQNDVFRIPAGTSAELRDLLIKLLKKNYQERINFADFFNHPFVSARPKAAAQCMLFTLCGTSN